MGRALKKLGWRRDSYWSPPRSSGALNGPDAEEARSTRTSSTPAHAALRRLDVDYLDLFFCHRPDLDTPIEETVRAMHDLVSQGKVLYWGTSEWSADEIITAWQIAEKHHLHKPVMEQPQTTCCIVTASRRSTRACIGTSDWAPRRGSGSLDLPTGKHPTAASRQARYAQGLVARRAAHRSGGRDGATSRADRRRSRLHARADVACLVSQGPNVSTVITGASRPAQVVENMSALDVVAGSPRVAMIDAALAAPTPGGRLRHESQGSSDVEPARKLERGTAFGVSVSRVRGGRGRHAARRALSPACRRSRGAGRDLAEPTDGARSRSAQALLWTREPGSWALWCARSGGAASSRSSPR